MLAESRGKCGKAVKSAIEGRFGHGIAPSQSLFPGPQAATDEIRGYRAVVISAEKARQMLPAVKKAVGNLCNRGDITKIGVDIFPDLHNLFRKRRSRGVFRSPTGNEIKNPEEQSVALQQICRSAGALLIQRPKQIQKRLNVLLRQIQHRAGGPGRKLPGEPILPLPGKCVGMKIKHEAVVNAFAPEATGMLTARGKAEHGWQFRRVNRVVKDVVHRPGNRNQNLVVTVPAKNLGKISRRIAVRSMREDYPGSKSIVLPSPAIFVRRPRGNGQGSGKKRPPIKTGLKIIFHKNHIFEIKITNRIAKA